MQVVFRDLKFALRKLIKSPGFSITAVLMLAFGIGATTAIFSIVEGVLLRPLPFPEPDRLVVLSDMVHGKDSVRNGSGVTGPDVVAYTRDTQTFESLGGYQQTDYELSGLSAPAHVRAARFTGGVFPVLRVTPLLGRVFTQQEDEQAQQVAVLSYSTWQSRFNGNQSILGSKILLDRNPYTVIGVMPRNFEFPLLPGQLNRSELWVPMSFAQREITGGGATLWNFRMVGRLKPGISMVQAQNDAERVVRQTVSNFLSSMAGVRINAVVSSLQEDTIQHSRKLVNTLFLAVTVVLLIACANLAGLLLVRAIRRRHEAAIRLAMGASAAALLRQAVLESVVLSVTGGLLGLILAAVAMRVGVSLLPRTLPRINEISLDWQVVIFALLLAAVTGVVCGLAPGLTAMRTSINDVLKEGGRTGTPGGGHARLRLTLVIAEVAVAMVLLTASGLLLRSFDKMRNVNLGFISDHILTAAYALPPQQYATQSAVDEFNNEFLRRLRQLPGITAAGWASLLPASGAQSNIVFFVEGYVPPKDGNLNLAWPSYVHGDYLRAMGIPLLRGRFFTEADNAANAQLAVIVNRRIADHYWPGQDPIGRRLHWGTRDTPAPWMTVVGEVDDVKQDSPDQDTREQVYQPLNQALASYGTLVSSRVLVGAHGHVVLRTALPPEQMEESLRAAARSLDPQLPLIDVQTMERIVSDSAAPRRFNTTLITAFAAAALLLAVLGIYSVIAFSVELRVHEFAIRMALGSQRSGILSLILISGGRLAVGGCILGLTGAVITSSLLRSFLFGVSPFDPLVLALAAVFVLLLALAASLIPARRAASIDPLAALRSE